MGGSRTQKLDLAQDFWREGALEHPSFHTDVNKSRKSSFFPMLILGLLGMLKVYHGHCSSCVMHYSESTTDDDFILAWWIYTAGWVCKREKQEYQMRNTVVCLQSNL